MEFSSSVACLEKGMKELHPIEKRSLLNKRLTSKVNPKKRTRVVTRVRSKAPTSTSPEIPILYTLLGPQEGKALTKDVLKELGSAKWFSELDDDDRKARYPESKKKIVDSVIKFAKKNLVLKGQVFPPGKDAPFGTWKITRKGCERAAMYRSSWSPKYSVHNDAIIIEYER